MLNQSFPRWRVGRTAIDDREVRVVQGIGDAQALANFYFDASGLLVRLVRLDSNSGWLRAASCRRRSTTLITATSPASRCRFIGR